MSPVDVRDLGEPEAVVHYPLGTANQVRLVALVRALDFIRLPIRVGVHSGEVAGSNDQVRGLACTRRPASSTRQAAILRADLVAWTRPVRADGPGLRSIVVCRQTACLRATRRYAVAYHVAMRQPNLTTT